MKKIGWFLLVPMIILGALALLSSPVVATVVTLDGVDNVGWSANLPIHQTYLYVAKADSSGYYYQWNYGSGSLPWTSVQDLVNDLSNNVLDQAGGIKKVVDWKIESGGNAFNPQNNGVIYQTLTGLSPGWYSLRLTSDSQAYNLKSYLWPKETPADLNVWNAYVQIDAEYSGGGSDSFNFGKYDYWQSTEVGALQYYRANVDGLQIYLADTADLRFYINDFNSVDNAGSVSLEFNPVPLPGSLYLLGPGLAFLLARRFKLRA